MCRFVPLYNSLFFSHTDCVIKFETFVVIGFCFCKLVRKKRPSKTDILFFSINGNNFGMSKGDLRLCKEKNFKKSEITMEVGGWAQVSLGIFFCGKSYQNSPKPVLIFWSSIPCVFCLHCQKLLVIMI